MKATSSLSSLGPDYDSSNLAFPGVVDYTYKSRWDVTMSELTTLLSNPLFAGFMGFLANAVMVTAFLQRGLENHLKSSPTLKQTVAAEISASESIQSIKKGQEEERFMRMEQWRSQSDKMDKLREDFQAMKDRQQQRDEESRERQVLRDAENRELMIRLDERLAALDKIMENRNTRGE